MKPILHAVTGKNRYCGPTAVATVLGITTDHAAQLMRSYSGSRAIRGASIGELCGALRGVGCKLSGSGVQFALGERPTVAAWLKTFEVPRNQHVIVIHGEHYGTILNRHYLCSLTKRERVSLADIPMRRARVQGWITVDTATAAAPAPIEPQRRREVSATRRAREEAQRLAAQHNIAIDRMDGGGFMVWPPEPIADTDRDPHDGDHYASDWSDVASMVREYAALLTPEGTACTRTKSTS